MKRILSGIQASGDLHIGNYLGALKHWVSLQNEHEALYGIVDLHAITVSQNPEALRKNTMEAAKIFLACGVDPKKSAIFVQSHILEHANLGWIFTTLTKMSEMSKMTQFKDKSQKHSENINVGLFSYPILMSADILLYRADLVPVGDDQTQHLEFCRNIAARFNRIYGNTFVVPEQYTPKTGARIMGLDDPSVKMSKSASSPNNFISLRDDADTIRKKIGRAVTDSGNEIRAGKDKPAMSNLVNIYSGFSDLSAPAVQSRFQGKTYKEFKDSLAELLIENLSPIQAKMADYDRHEDAVFDALKKGAAKASEIATKTYEEVKEKMGFLPL
ncbi:MAG: tryptophan--tRNA ligase [Parcubacteria group bacterium]|nr:tryptophan--tRNA ligase [Parcubacteria group bacterium]